jgi:hypothetical protein
MEYEPSDNVPDINNHVFDDNTDNDEAEDDDGDIVPGTDSPNNVKSKPCLMDWRKFGWEEIDKMKLKEVRKHGKERQCRKRYTMKYIMQQVIDMKSSTGSISICEEHLNPV